MAYKTAATSLVLSLLAVSHVVSSQHILMEDIPAGEHPYRDAGNVRKVTGKRQLFGGNFGGGGGTGTAARGAANQRLGGLDGLFDNLLGGLGGTGGLGGLLKGFDWPVKILRNTVVVLGALHCMAWILIVV